MNFVLLKTVNTRYPTAAQEEDRDPPFYHLRSVPVFDHFDVVSLLKDAAAEIPKNRGPGLQIRRFEVIKVIHEKLLDMVGKVQVPIMLVGNKKDLHMERVISCEEGKALADSWNAAFMESSAKENQTAVEVFKRTILEAEKMEGGAPQGRTSCSLM
ncbi:GTP-binding protein Rheb isoform 2-T5 [Salvelinus alpinus]